MAEQDNERNGAEAKASDAIKLLKQEHQSIGELLDAIGAEQGDEQGKAAEKIFDAWVRHSLVEQELFMPAAKESGVEGDKFVDAEVERDLAGILLIDIARSDPSSDMYSAKLRVFAKLAREIMEGEERPRSGLFAKAKAAGVDIKALGPKIEARLQQLKEGERTPEPSVRHIRLPSGPSGQYQQEKTQMRQSNMRDRDDQGRFTRDDDRGGRGGGRMPERDDRGRFMSDDDRGGGYRSRGRDDYDDRRGGGRGHGGWFGDSEGHSEASRRGWDERDGSRSRGRDYDDDRRYSRGRDDDDGRGHGRGGWFGDSEGHSEASRRGWDERGGSRSRGRDYDDDRRSSRNRDDDDGRGHGRGGWFGDSEGHSEAARRGWENSDHGPSGWYGDSEGHSEASRRGWDNPRHRESGWFGDPEGHSEASRRGWEGRR